MNAIRARFARRIIGTSVISTLFLLAGLQHAALASPGDVDPSFGFAGKSVTDVQQAADETLAISIQTDGKIIAVGNVQSPRSFLISRHNTDGSLDTSFGSAGKVVTTFSAGPSSANAVAIQSDGKIVVAGYAGDLLALARYSSDGALDQSFGSAGSITARFEPDRLDTVALASSVAIQSDGKIVVAGDSFVLNPLARDYAIDCNFGVARYNSDGSPDETFGIAGTIISDFGSFDRADALAIQSDGKLVVAGDSNSTGTGPYTLILVRYNSDGTLDPTLGVTGRVVPVAGSFEVSALALQPSDKIVVAGTYTSASPANADFALARYNSDGTLDATFGVGGTSVTDFGWTYSDSRDNRAFALALQPDGKILLGGYSTSSFALARYNGDGSLDATFGTGGVAITQVSAIGSSTISFPIAGSTFSTSDSSFSSGIIIPICCSSVPAGVRLDLLRVEQAFALAIQPNGKIIAGGVVDGHAALVRYHGATTPKLTVGNVGVTIPHGDVITFKPPNGFTTLIYVGNIPQTGIGGIVSFDHAISCGTRCSAAYDAGSALIVNAVWPVGSYFVDWDGCAPVAGGGCAVTLNQDTQVIATFEPDLPFTVDTTILPDTEVGVSYAKPSGITGGRLPISAKVISGKMPQGLSFNGRNISGTPVKAGKFTFKAEFTDALGFPAQKSFTLTILKPLNISTATLKTGHRQKTYTATLKVNGGKAPYLWSVLSGNLPAAVTLDDATGQITGVPADPGTYELTIRVTDSLAQTSDKTFTLVIR